MDVMDIIIIIRSLSHHQTYSHLCYDYYNVVFILK